MILQSHIDDLKSLLDRLIVTPLVVENNLRIEVRAGEQAYVKGLENNNSQHMTQRIKSRLIDCD